MNVVAPSPGPSMEPAAPGTRKSTSRMSTMAHGGGGKAMRDLIEDVFITAFDNDTLSTMEDQGTLPSLRTGHARRPPGDDDGLLRGSSAAVSGRRYRQTRCLRHDQRSGGVGGAIPLYLTCAVIIEEGLEIDTLREIAGSRWRAPPAQPRISIVTGDTKVVNRGACDKLFINTTGIGVIREGIELGTNRVQPGRCHPYQVNRAPGRSRCGHPVRTRRHVVVDPDPESDCTPLCTDSIDTLLASAAPCGRGFCVTLPEGGIATVLNEVAEASQVGASSSMKTARRCATRVRGFCEILGLDPLYLANEETARSCAPCRRSRRMRRSSPVRNHPLGRDGAIIGHATDGRPGRVVMHTVFGGRRIVDMLVGEQLPRIC